jgi:hypothetical protein
MSLSLYTIRIYWDGRRGALRWGPHDRALTAPPALPGFEKLRIDEIDFAPEAQVAQLREPAGAWRDMTAAEVAAAMQLLRSLAIH